MEKKFIYCQSLLLPWIKSSISINQSTLLVNERNTLLCFPLGQNNQSIAVKNISASSTIEKYDLKKMVIGGILFLWGVTSFFNSFEYFNFFNLILSLVIAVFGFNVAYSGLICQLIINRSGSNYHITVPFFERKKIKEINEIIHQLIMNDADKTDLSLYFDKK